MLGKFYPPFYNFYSNTLQNARQLGFAMEKC
jgi:hypothetical protein